jgi:putative peptidoglycan lipid II flippase
MIKKIFTNTFGILTSRILGFLRDLLMAQTLGANIYSDIFFVAFKFPNLFRRIFAEGAFTQSFIPTFTKARQRYAFAAAVLLRFLAIILALTLLVNLFAPFFTKLIAVGFDEVTIELAAPYVALNFWYLPLIFAVTFLAALLQYREHFATTAFATALLNLAMIAALLIAQGLEKPAIVFYLSLGVIAGGILQLLVHIAAAHRLGELRRLYLGFLRLLRGTRIGEDLRRFKKSFIPAIWGNSAAQAAAFLDTWLASFLAAGAISYLYYANRIFQLPLALFAIATATALFPYIAKAIAKGDEERGFHLIRRSFYLLTALLAASTLGGVILADEIVWLLFERGDFTRADTLATAEVLRMYMVGLVFYGLSKLFSLWLYAAHRQGEAAKIATYTLTANIILSLLLIAPLQAVGLALASSLAGAVQFWLLVRAFGWERFKALLKDRFAIYLLIALAAEAVILIYIKRLFDAYL